MNIKIMENIIINLDTDIDFDDYQFEDNGNSCYLCGCSNNVIYDTFIYKKSIRVKTCNFCNIITNFKRCHIGKVVLCHSLLSQKDIVIKTTKFVQTNNTIPFPTELDPNVQLINMSCFEFALMLSMNLKTEKKEDFTKFVFFLTQENTNILKHKEKNMFSSKPKKESVPYNIDCFDLPVYVFTKSELNAIEYMRLYISKNDHKSMKSNKEKIDIAIKKTSDIINFKNNLIKNVNIIHPPFLP